MGRVTEPDGATELDGDLELNEVPAFDFDAMNDSKFFGLLDLQGTPNRIQRAPKLAV